MMIYLKLMKQNATQVPITLYFQGFQPHLRASHSGWMLSCHGDHTVVNTFSEPIFESYSCKDCRIKCLLALQSHLCLMKPFSNKVLSGFYPWTCLFSVCWHKIL